MHSYLLQRDKRFAEHPDLQTERCRSLNFTFLIECDAIHLNVRTFIMEIE